MKRILLTAATACTLVACFQPEDDTGKNGLLQGSPGGGAGGGNGGSAGGAGGSGGNSATPGDPGDATCASLSLKDPGNSVQPGGACLCTRRDVVPNGTCPRGQNESASATIGPAGGSISLMGQQGAASGAAFTITFPPNAIATDTLITVTETRIVPPPGIVDWSPVYRIEPTGLALAEAAKLKIPMSQGRGSAYGDDKIGIFWSATEACTVERLPSSYANAGFMQGNVARLGYAIVAYAQPGGTPYCK